MRDIGENKGQGLSSQRELKNPVSAPGSSPINSRDRSVTPQPANEVSQIHEPALVSYSSISMSAETKEEPVTINNTQTLMHIFKANVGTGILSLPIAVKHAGLWTGIAGILCIGAVAVHCMHVLLNCSRKLCKRTGCTTLDYAGVMEVCLKTGPPWGQRFSRFVRPFVDTLLIVTQLGACCVYIVFIASNVQMVVASLVGGGPNVRIYQLCVMLVLVLLVCVKNLRIMAVFSGFANLLTVAGLIIVIQYIVQDLPDTSTRPAFTSVNEIPLFFGTAIFCIEGIGLVLPLRNSMRRPDDFGGWAGVLNLGMVSTVCLCATVGFYGYLKFGDGVQSTVTLSLPNDKLYLSVRLMFAVCILITYNIQFYVPITIMWPKLRTCFKQKFILEYGEYVFRIFVVLMTFGLAAVVPHVDLLISLIGAVACSFLALILPSFIEVVTMLEEDELPRHVLVKDVLIFLFGVFGSVIGTYTSLTAIVDTF